MKEDLKSQCLAVLLDLRESFVNNRGKTDQISNLIKRLEQKEEVFIEPVTATVPVLPKVHKPAKKK